MAKLMGPNNGRREVCHITRPPLCNGNRFSNQISADYALSDTLENIQFHFFTFGTMAAADVQEDLTCSICLNLYTDPVTLNCGHNFCQECIKTYLDTKQRNGEEYSCPQCRKGFRDRPELQKNTNLSNIAEKVKCSADQEKRKCSDHNRILEYYCTWDSTCICKLCRLDGIHRGHEVETLEEASERKKNKLRNDLQKLTDARKSIDMRVRDINQDKAKVTKHTAEISEKVSVLFIDIRKRVDDLEKRVRREISRQEEQIDIANIIHKLEVQKEELSKKIGRLEELIMADPTTLLQDQDSDIQTEYNLDLCRYEAWEPDEFIISMMLHKGLSDIEQLKDVLFPLPSEGTNITLYINTADEFVEISDDRKTAKSTDVKQERPNPAHTFMYGGVFSTREFSSGKHYWMVEGSTSGDWGIGMCYPSISKDNELIGRGRSWGIQWSEGSYYVPYMGNRKPLNDTNSSNRLLVYLDYEAGRLSFYELYDPLHHLHTFTDKFTEPLRAVIQVRKDNEHSQITILQEDAWCNPMLGPITSV